MRKLVVWSVVIIGLILMVGSITLFLTRVFKAAKPEFDLPDNPIVFLIAEEYGHTVGFINPDGSSFTTRQIEIDQSVFWRYSLLEVSWGPDRIFLVIKVIGDDMNINERIPAIITEKGEVHICKQFYTGPTQGIDSTHILTDIQMSPNGPVELVVMDLKTCQIEQVSYTSPNGMYDFAVSPNGWLAYEPADSGIVVLDDQHKGILNIQKGYSPAWSEDGEWLAYSDSGIHIIVRSGTDTQQITGAGNSGIHIINRSGTDTQQITSAGTCPSWSPDGESLVYNDSGDIYIVNIASKQSTLLYSGGGCPSWQ